MSAADTTSETGSSSEGSHGPTGEAVGVAAVVVLAAGGGTRMKSAIAKPLHTLAGHSMLSYVLSAATALVPQRTVVVIGHQREQVAAHLAEIAPHAATAVQEQQLGSGHAVQIGLDALGDLQGDVVVTGSDAPMLTGETLAALVELHRSQQASVTVLSAEVPDATGYGRIVRDADGLVLRIVEHKDADEELRQIHEINSGVYVFDADVLRTGLQGLSTDNAQGELYLTDVLAGARQAGRTVVAYRTDDVWQTEGINDRVQLSAMNIEMNRRILHRWMRAGVTIVDPATTWIHAHVDIAADVTLLPGTSLEGATSIATGAVIGPDTTLVDVEVGERATISRTQATLSVIGADTSVGPFAYLRPGTTLGAGAKIGTFVETKNAQLGPGAKAPHLSYVGDAVIAEGANVGAGVIFANYDGVNKSTSTVGAYSFVGSNSVLAAPVHIADGAYVAAGSTVTGDVGPGELAVSRAQQRNIKGWVRRKRAATKTAHAAEAAESEQIERQHAAGEDES